MVSPRSAPLPFPPWEETPAEVAAWDRWFEREPDGDDEPDE